MTEIPAFLATCITIGFVSIAISLIFAFIRLVIGKTLADRIVALDLMSSLVIAFIALFSIARQETVYLDANIAFALVAFLSTVAFARYIERQDSNSEDTHA